MQITESCKIVKPEVQHFASSILELKGLQKAISMTILDWDLTEPEGWSFTSDRQRCSPDPLFGCKRLREIYLKADPNHQGKCSVPVLWDKKENTILSTESAQIILMLNEQFNQFCATP